MKPQVDIYTDGAARGNPDGPGGYGAILRFVDTAGRVHEREFSAGYDKTTNNRMELMAVIVALEHLTKPCTVRVYSDSQYLVRAMTEGWLLKWQTNGWRTSGKDPVKNRLLWIRLTEAAAAHDISWNWVKGHAGHPENERCDALATTAADGPPETLLHDDGEGALKE